jgi:hypothetical protein
MNDVLPRLPQLPSTICEAHVWIITSVKEAQAAKESFVRISFQRSAYAGDERCDVFRWVRKSVTEVVKLKTQDPGLQLRCLECKQPVRVHCALLPTESPAPHFEHYRANARCSLSDV